MKEHTGNLTVLCGGGAGGSGTALAGSMASGRRISESYGPSGVLGFKFEVGVFGCGDSRLDIFEFGFEVP